MPVAFTAYADEGTDIRAKLFPALSAANAFILTMKEEEMSLEDIFLQLTKTPAEATDEENDAEVEVTEDEADQEESIVTEVTAETETEGGKEE